MARTVERDRLGAWLLKANPAVWDLRAFLNTGERRLTSWAVRPGYRSALMRPGDKVLFWVSGDGRDGLVRGLWGLGRLTAPVVPWAEDEHGYWHEAAGRAGVRARVELDVALLDEPVEHTELRMVGVDDLEVQRQPFAANPSWVSREQLDRLSPLLPPWPS
ncbi:EVE domain-containing protein [Auraticoccus monumenti]|uniref:EVE domain-containing protein n=1 Tax=Auraticoccus monumenti TaxID=675864 RepID=A0A1G6ZWX4_9ACTN|nr:EVE domain-containing protein [Auraticoccus monumenti]SDE07168.1 EVE domain-containing protein [Auraticoccus monumenti]